MSDTQESTGLANDPSTGSEPSLPAKDEPIVTRTATMIPDEISPELLNDPYGEEEMDISRGDFEELLSQHQTASGDIKEGEIVKARVLRVSDSSVILEFGFKSEGAVSKDEFKDADQIETGHEVEVLLESLEDDDGVVVLSKKKADFLRVWELIKEAYENDRPVEGTLTRKIKGGVTVDIMGVDAFLPGSQIALRRVPNIEDLIGDAYDFKIIKLNKRRRNIVVSRRVILEGERQKKRSTLVKELLVGQVREGVVKNITDFGAFIDLGGGSTDCSTSPTCPGAEWDIRPRSSTSGRIWTSRSWTSIGTGSASPWASSSFCPTPGRTSPSGTPSAPGWWARWSPSRTTGHSWSCRRAWRAWSTSPRCPGRGTSVTPSKLVSIGDEIEAVVLKVDPKEEKISLGNEADRGGSMAGPAGQVPHGAPSFGGRCGTSRPSGHSWRSSPASTAWSTSPT